MVTELRGGTQAQLWGPTSKEACSEGHPVDLGDWGRGLCFFSLWPGLPHSMPAGLKEWGPRWGQTETASHFVAPPLTCLSQTCLFWGAQGIHLTYFVFCSFSSVTDPILVFFFVWFCFFVWVRLALNLSTPCLSLLSVKRDYSWLSEYTLPDRLMGEFREKILENHGTGNILPVIFKTIKHQIISKKMYASFCLWFSHTKPRWVWLKNAPQVHPISLPPLFLTAATGDAARRSPSTMQGPHLHCSWDPDRVHRQGLQGGQCEAKFKFIKKRTVSVCPREECWPLRRGGRAEVSSRWSFICFRGFQS